VVRRAEQTYTFAARQLDELDLSLEDVRCRLRTEGYLSAESRLDKLPMRG
jgi:hypothetical protein